MVGVKTMPTTPTPTAARALERARHRLSDAYAEMAVAVAEDPTLGVELARLAGEIGDARIALGRFLHSGCPEKTSPSRLTHPQASGT